MTSGGRLAAKTDCKHWNLTDRWTGLARRLTRLNRRMMSFGEIKRLFQRRHTQLKQRKTIRLIRLDFSAVLTKTRQESQRGYRKVTNLSHRDDAHFGAARSRGLSSRLSVFLWLSMNFRVILFFLRALNTPNKLIKRFQRSPGLPGWSHWISLPVDLWNWQRNWQFTITSTHSLSLYWLDSEIPRASREKKKKNTAPSKERHIRSPENMAIDENQRTHCLRACSESALSVAAGCTYTVRLVPFRSRCVLHQKDSRPHCWWHILPAETLAATILRGNVESLGLWISLQ